GYIVIKVQDEGTYPERWKHKHVVVWEKEYGKVPNDHVVSFLDGNKTNIDLDNLVLLHREVLSEMNRNGYFSTNPDVTRSRIALVNLDKKILEVDLMGGDKEKFMEYARKAEKNGIENETFKARIKRGWNMH